MNSGCYVAGFCAGESVDHQQVRGVHFNGGDGGSDDFPPLFGGQDAPFFAGEGQVVPLRFDGLTGRGGALLLLQGSEFGVNSGTGNLGVGEVDQPFDDGSGEPLLLEQELFVATFQVMALVAARGRLVGFLPVGVQVVPVGQGPKEVDRDPLVNGFHGDHPGFVAEAGGLVGLAAVVTVIGGMVVTSPVVVPGADAPTTIPTGEDIQGRKESAGVGSLMAAFAPAPLSLDPGNLVAGQTGLPFTGIGFAGLGIFAERQAEVEAVIGNGSAHEDGRESQLEGYGAGAVLFSQVPEALHFCEGFGINDGGLFGWAVPVGFGKRSPEEFAGALRLGATFFHAGLQDAHFDGREAAFHQKQHPVGVLRRVEDAGQGGELYFVDATEMEPGYVVLKGVVSGESGEFDGENDLNGAGTNGGFEAAPFPQVFSLAAGGAGVAVVEDYRGPALGHGVGGKLFALHLEPVGRLVFLFARFADVDGGGHGGLAVDFAAVADLDDTYRYCLVVDFRDDPVITDSVFPVVSQNSRKWFAQYPRIF